MVGTAGLDAGSSCVWLDWPLTILCFLCLLCSKRLKCLSLKLLLFILFPYPASRWLQELCSTWYFVLSHVFRRDNALSTAHQLPFWGRSSTPLQYLLVCSPCVYFHLVFLWLFYWELMGSNQYQLFEQLNAVCTFLIMTSLDRV